MTWTNFSPRQGHVLGLVAEQALALAGCEPGEGGGVQYTEVTARDYQSG